MLSATRAKPAVGTTVPPDRESGTRVRGDVGANAASTAKGCFAAAAGLDVCAKRARDPHVVERASALARAVRALGDEAARRVPGDVRRPSMSERMRWEWLASTAARVDGGPERRLLAEVADLLDDVDDERAVAMAATVRSLATDDTVPHSARAVASL